VVRRVLWFALEAPGARAAEKTPPEEKRPAERPPAPAQPRPGFLEQQRRAKEARAARRAAQKK
jgi:hypothetical protein